MIKSTKTISFFLLIAMLISSLFACSPSYPPTVPNIEDFQSSNSNKEQEQQPSDSGSLSDKGQQNQPSDSDSSSEGESGTLGDPSLPLEPEIIKPENPAKMLLAKSQENYNGGNLGCTNLTILAEYNQGVDFNTQCYRDSTNKIFYLYLPCRGDLSSVTFTVTHRDGSQSGPYTADFSDDEISDNEKVFGNASLYSIKVLQSNLPSIMFQIDESYGTVDAMNNDENHATYTYGTMVATVTDEMAEKEKWQTHYESCDENANEHCSVKIRGRGNATWEYSKKPYQFVTENEIDLFGMGKAKKYVLLANYNDATGMRTQLALEMAQLANVPYTSDYRQVDVFMNGEYLGMYMVVEKVEVGENRVEIDQNNDILFEFDNYAAVEEFGFQTKYTNIRQRGFRVHNPETQEGLSRAKEIIDRAEAALYSQNPTLFAQYFDVDSWARMYLVQMFTMNNDAYCGSLYFYYNNRDGKLYACAPWDFDWSFGVSYTTSSNYLNPMKFDVENVEWMKQIIKYESFVRAVLQLYDQGGGRELLNSMLNLIARYAEENRKSALMNETLGKVLLYPQNTVKNYDDALAYLEDIATRRLQYMHNKMEILAQRIDYTIKN